MQRRLLAGVVFVLGLGGAPFAATAQSCGGDCDGDGAVSVSELITAVNIVLGSAVLDACPAILGGGSGPPGVSHLIAAVNNALCACGPCPPPLPTRTPTATPRPPTVTATVSATPTPTPVVSTWIEDTFRLTGSNCPKQVNDAVRAELPGQSETYRISEHDGAAVVEASDGSTEIAMVDDSGVLHDTFSQSDSQGSCVVVVDGEIAVSLRMAQSTATYHYDVSSSGCPRNLRCRATITSRWRRTDLPPSP